MHGWLPHSEDSEASPCMYTAGHSGKGAYATYHADSAEVVHRDFSFVCLFVVCCLLFVVFILLENAHFCLVLFWGVCAFLLLFLGLSIFLVFLGLSIFFWYCFGSVQFFGILGSVNFFLDFFWGLSIFSAVFVCVCSFFCFWVCPFFSRMFWVCSFLVAFFSSVHFLWHFLHGQTHL